MIALKPAAYAKCLRHAAAADLRASGIGRVTEVQVGINPTALGRDSGARKAHGQASRAVQMQG